MLSGFFWYKVQGFPTHSQIYGKNAPTVCYYANKYQKELKLLNTSEICTKSHHQHFEADIMEQAVSVHHKHHQVI